MSEPDVRKILTMVAKNLMKLVVATDFGHENQRGDQACCRA
jgi:hypothetical protein